MVTPNRLLISVLICIIPFLGNATTALRDADSELMESARSYYAQGDFKKSIDLYSKIPASSDFWLDAIEERAWSYTRMNDFESALADLHSLTSAVWSSQVGPETYMLSTFVSLKICAYKDVAKKINIFKKRMLPRIDALENLIAKPLPLEFKNMSESLKNNQITMASLGRQAEKYPRYFFRDRQLLAAVKAGANDKVEARMKELATQDLAEIELNLKKMKIIDVELIQKVLLSEKAQKSRKSDLQFSSVDKNQKMIFPVTDEEVWVDEVGHFQVKADLCPSKMGKTL